MAIHTQQSLDIDFSATMLHSANRSAQELWSQYILKDLKRVNVTSNKVVSTRTLTKKNKSRSLPYRVTCSSIWVPISFCNSSSFEPDHSRTCSPIMNGALTSGWDYWPRMHTQGGARRSWPACRALRENCHPPPSHNSCKCSRR